jgi:predicted NBD/HSP70 family sugar kinase
VPQRSRRLTAAPLDQRAVRRHNLALVLGRLVADGASSRATLAAETGLNKTTVSSLVADLIHWGLVVESDVLNPGSVGRPATAVKVNGEGVVGIGLEINIDYLAVIAVDLLGRQRERVLVAVDNRGRSPARVLSHLTRLATGVLDGVLGQGLVPVGATLAVPGLVDVGRGELMVSPNLGWTRTRLASMLRKRLAAYDLAVLVDNEANLAALAELWSGTGQRVANFLYVSGEVGIGAGVVLNGELLRGAHGFAGELGHVTVDPDGALCTCGSRGCLEAYVGLEALLRSAALAFTEGPGTVTQDDWIPALLERAESDARVAAGLFEVGRWLGIAVAGVANVVDPQAVVLGGFFAPLAEWLRESMCVELSQRWLPAPFTGIEVVASPLGPDAAVRGAAMLSVREILADPATLDTLIEVS